MRRHSKVGIIALVLFSSAMLSAVSCGQSMNNRQSSNEPGRDTKGSPSSSSASEDLGGTYWSLMSMTTKGETEKESGSPPDVEFCRNGSWGMLHYGGAREAGTYQVQGSRLIMKMEDGSLYGNFQVKRNGNDMTLDDGKYVLRLKYRHQAGC